MLAANLVKDIAVGSSGSSPTTLTTINGLVYFTATDSTNGTELWKSDGTSAGTVLIKDIRPGAVSGLVSYSSSLTNLNGTLYFYANDGTSGIELWKSDGTTAGTVLVKDIRPGIGSSIDGRPMLNLNGTLYFSATDGTNGFELWKSDGTAAGTSIVKDIRSGITGSYARYLTNVNGTIYFRANDGSADGLWKSNGTAAGTVLVSSACRTPKYFTNVSGTLYFVATDTTHGEELWRSDGTTAGTMLLEIAPGTTSSTPRELTNVNGTLYFVGSDGFNGNGLWKSDAAGTVYISSGGTQPRYLTNVNGTLFFAATDNLNGHELRRSDGTIGGTILVKEIQPGSGSSISGPLNFTNVNGWLVFKADDGVNGDEVWISNGTSQGTKLLADVFTGAGSSFPSQFAVLGTKILFKATGTSIGAELWSIDLFPQTPTTWAGGIATVDLSGSTSNRSLSVRMTAGGLALRDLVTDVDILGPTSDLPINGVQGFRIIGSTAFSESITIDHSFGGVVDLPKGLEFDGGAGGTDTVTIIGAAGFDATISQTATDVNILSGVGAAGVPLKYRNVESLTMTAMRRVSVSGNLDVGIPITVSNQLPLDLGEITTLSGGTLASSGLVSLGAAESIVGTGTLTGRFAGEAGSMILASGNMTIGNASSTAGFLTRGELDAGTSTVTLLDSNQAVLGSLTSLGNATTIGTLSAANGALIDFGNNLIGYGTLNTPNLVAKQTTINGSVEGVFRGQADYVGWLHKRSRFAEQCFGYGNI